MEWFFGFAVNFTVKNLCLQVNHCYLLLSFDTIIRH